MNCVKLLVQSKSSLKYHSKTPITRNAWCSFVNATDEKIYKYYDFLKKFDKMPICVQILCWRPEEEELFASGSIVDTALKSKANNNS